VVLLTQPTLWREGLSPAELDLLWGGGPPLGRLADGAVYYSAEALAEAMGSYNAALLAVCRERGVECLDVAQQIPSNAAVFYDDAHFTERGSAILTELVADYLLDHEPFRAETRPAREQLREFAPSR
jgi:hypothetical protein